MKKLLTLLGSVGMVAATAATVVACSKPKEEEKFDATVAPTGTNEIKVKNDDLKTHTGVKAIEVDKDGKEIKEAEKQLLNVTAVLAPATGTEASTHKLIKFTAKDKAGKAFIKLSGVKAEKAGESELFGTLYKVNIAKHDISKGIEIKAYRGETKAEVEKLIHDEISKKANGATLALTTDYTITGLVETLVGSEEVTVKAAADSKVITGEFKFTVSKEAKPDDKTVNVAALKTEIQTSLTAAVADGQAAIVKVKAVLANATWSSKVTGTVVEKAQAEKTLTVTLTPAEGFTLNGTSPFDVTYTTAAPVDKTVDVAALKTEIQTSLTAAVANETAAIGKVNAVLTHTNWNSKVTGTVAPKAQAEKTLTVTLTPAEGFTLNGTSPFDVTYTVTTGK
ncbi:hypothetical protein ELUMI_v1c08580 [Williamsoniiplasma luminosum]|uniref:Variable surface lipoprotein n=1 Tax=Williamsoniiplasma luminosum TaxID=214888 RepID=A0A2K8NUU2_9MOLU|nr:lipoprotein [Williamsoniiplasma luminosum]ATZ17579.1 hypothetical protein ELUMI_v1c08580 [Williamsoniiplasma luminosum]